MNLDRPSWHKTGKIDSCIVTVHLAYAHGDFHALLDGELFLPECWNPDTQNELVTEKRRKAGIPEDVVHESKPAMALRQLRRARENGVRASSSEAAACRDRRIRP